jgi:hypothetical protein
VGCRRQATVYVAKCITRLVSATGNSVVRHRDGLTVDCTC